MAREYWLIKEVKTIGCKNNLRVVDRITANGLKDARHQLAVRNEFGKIIIKADLFIACTQQYIA